MWWVLCYGIIIIILIIIANIYWVFTMIQVFLSCINLNDWQWLHSVEMDSETLSEFSEQECCDWLMMSALGTGWKNDASYKYIHVLWFCIINTGRMWQSTLREAQRGVKFRGEIQEKHNVKVEFDLALTEVQTFWGEVERREKRIVSRGNNLNRMLRQEDVGCVNGQLVFRSIW